MGTRGPPPTPTNILAMRGSWRSKRNPHEPHPEPGRPRCPRWLDKQAKAAWKQLAPQLDRMGVLAKVDGNALARYCQLWASVLSHKFGNMKVPVDVLVLYKEVSMGRGCVLEPLTLTEEQRDVLTGWTRRRKTAQALALRARIILRCAKGGSNLAVADALDVSRLTVGKWRRRFLDLGVDGLLDEPRPGAPRKITDADVERVITLTLESKPRDATHWSTRSMAEEVGLSQTAISRIWRAFALQPHRTETFKLSNDPLFVDKVRDIVGLYLDPPDKALVLSVDEKAQIQALDRTQPLLPMRPGQAERRTHDYVRHGTTTLFAALDVKSGRIIGKCYRKHRATEFRRFLGRIDDAVPDDLDVHLILDNYSTHKTPAIRRWLAKRPRYHVHFTPTYSSWINLVERWFAALTQKQLRRGVHRSTRQLEIALRSYVEIHNEDPRPFVWSKTADEILENVARFCKRTSNSGH
jgi:transposase